MTSARHRDISPSLGQRQLARAMKGVMCFEMRTFIGIVLLCIGISPSIMNASEQKERIAPQAVERIDVVKRSCELLGHLGASEIDEFVNAWNAAQPIGLCKFIFEYRFSVQLKNGRKIEYRTNGENIKEENDYCYSVQERELYRRLWGVSKEQ